MKKYLEILHIMLKYTPEKNSTNMYRQLSAIYWGALFTWLFLVAAAAFLFYQLYKTVL